MTQAAKDAAKFLKSSLRLPTSTFPPRPPPADLAKYLPRCTDELYAWQRQERPASQTFVLHDGPPYANGDLHVGHALNKIVKDIICRSRLLQGKRVDYVPGWDCHGLPIELKALEANGWERGQGVDPVAIRKAARKFAFKTVEKQMAGFRSWGIMGDWKNHWKTMHKDFELRQLSVFRAMAEHGLIYRKRKPVFWSPSSGTALAEAELEYQEDHASTAALVKFPLHGAYSSLDGNVCLVIWTTTPWTLPANQAIAISDALQYSIVRSDTHGLLLVANTRIPYLEHAIGETVVIVEEFVSTELLKKCRYSGLSEFGAGASQRPIIHANFVSADSGTGLVHCAPGHGMEDYEALQPLITSGAVVVKAPVDNLGRFDDSASPDSPELLTGQYVFKQGNATVLKLLKQNGLLVHHHTYKHKYPIDWRTKEPVIIRATAQWFADISSIKQSTLQALEAVKFIPDSGKTRLRSFVENRSEWCISRQRAWGVPIPALYHKTTGEPVLTSETIGHILKVIDERGIDAWWADDEDEPAWIWTGLSSTDYVRGTDTMDVWFDSGSSWTFMTTDDNPQVQPLADIYFEGSDQHRGWFQSSLLTNVAYQKSLNPSSEAHAPFRSLVTHGFTLDAQGKKMSKSLGNVIAPAQIIAGLEPASKNVTSQASKKQRQIHPLGPDALRLWVAGSDWTKDVVISETVVKTVHTALDKYRVTMKLLLGLLQDFTLDDKLNYQDLATLDQIALLQLQRVSATVAEAMADLEFHKAVIALNRWVAADLSGFYFEAIKDILYCEPIASQRRKSAQTTIHHILDRFQMMIAPMTPLLVEESWEHCSEHYKAAVEHPLKKTWTSPPSEWDNQQLSNVLPIVMSVNTGVKAAQEQARSNKLLGQSLASDVEVYIRHDIDVSAIPKQTWQEVLVVSGFELLQDADYRGRAARVSSPVPDWTFSSDIQSTAGEAIGLAIVRSPHAEKCSRCWKYNATPQKDDGEVIEGAVPILLCSRCEDAVAEYEESRQKV